MRYGITYQGSKNAIAEQIIGALPAGKRLVDLFGGGFAISHCALLSGKWRTVIYNDINPLLPKLIWDAICGAYNPDRWTPAWVSMEQFNDQKMTDGYVKYCWSYGCNGWDYLYSKEKEEGKHKLHDAYFRGEIKKIPRENRLIHMERIHSLQALEKLSSIVYHGGLGTLNIDYRDYEHEEGDVVYCDIPYQNAIDPRVTKQYGRKFDHGAFYAWAVSRPYPVYFSSYKLGGIVWEGDKRGTMNRKNDDIRREVLYCVDNEFTPPGRYYQGHLFT